MPAGRPGTLPLARSFTGAACDYWLEIFPRVNRELAVWRGLARRIPDPRLRELALQTQRAERGNLEGAAAFAVLVPRLRRGAMIRAAVSFQALYDYLDTLSEQPAGDPVEHARSLHLLLPAALGPRASRVPRLPPAVGDAGGGYLAALVAESRSAVAELPSWHLVAGEAIAAAERMVVYQSLVHCESERSRMQLERWAAGLTPAGSRLGWWETAAGAASSLAVFALFAAAARPALAPGEATAVRTAYFPWIGALHVLLDSLVDRDADLATGHLSLVGNYASPEQMAARLGTIAARAAARARRTSQAERHALILGAMASFYLSRPAARAPGAELASERVLAAIGPSAAPAMALLRARGSLGRLLGRPREAANISLGPVT